MSADNGIYILETIAWAPKLSLPNSKEYRVAHLQNIEQLYSQDGSGDELAMWRMFHDALKFTSEKDALSHASKLTEKYDILEYGISIVPIRKAFPKKKPRCPNHQVIPAPQCDPAMCFRCGED